MICTLQDSPVDALKLAADLKRDEGLRLKPYRDTRGNLTIGWGTNLDAGITLDEASYLLSSRIQHAIRTAEAQAWWPKVEGCEPRARAFIELVYNLGIGTLASFRQALDAAMRSDWPASAEAFRNSYWFNQVGNRAEKICSMIQTGEDA